MKTISSFLMAVLLLVGSSDAAAQKNKKTKVENPLIVRTYVVKDFQELEVSGSVKVVYTQGPLRVRAKGTEAMLQTLHLKQQPGKMHIYDEDRRGLKRERQRIVVYVSTPQLSELNLSGASLFEAEKVQAAAFNFTASGASKSEIDRLNCKSLEVHASGASEVEIEGASDKSTITLSGASDGDFNLQGASATLTASGATNVDIDFVGNKLKISNSGAAKCEAEVNCREVEFSASGAAKITAEGKAPLQSIRTSGAGSVNTAKLLKK